MAETVRVEKRKWDGSVSTIDLGCLVPANHDAYVWFVPAGSERDRPRKGFSEILEHDEIWAGVPGEWWVLCGEGDAEGSITRYMLHAAAPFAAPEPGLISWVDLDLDFDVHDREVSLNDETQFHQHAQTMGYPPEVVRGAWSGISRVAPQYTTGGWPFDGWLEGCLKAARAGP
jgi:hypothetical protein